MLKYLIILSVSLLSLAGFTQDTLNADQYFDRAAERFIYNDKAQALRFIDKGLRQDPNHEQLQELAKKILEQNQNKQQQRKQQQQKQQQQQKEQEQKQNQKKQQQQQQEQNKENKQEKKDQQGSKNQEKKEEQKQQMPRDGKLSKKDAERMLNALKDNEKKVQEKVNQQNQGTIRQIEKDW